MNANTLVLVAAVGGLILAYKYGNDMVKGVATVVAGGVALQQLPGIVAKVAAA